MLDIYHAISNHNFEKVSNEALEEYEYLYSDASTSAISAMCVIGNLLSATEEDEEYTDQDAKRDLHLIGSVLRHLPRMSQALEQNSRNVTFELKKRKEAGAL
ncbi:MULTISPECIES: hypothetical protein [unclassified Serratia (in: enterobacteria)]|uniref:hypothetical protein n=1 Tax=unclassified Serratia (in: enterobacteria) TaxID=2647522 RepID=UPI0030763B5D